MSSHAVQVGDSLGDIIRVNRTIFVSKIYNTYGMYEYQRCVWILLGRGWVQGEQDGIEAFPGTTDSSIDQQHRTTFCAWKHARSSYKPATFMASGFLVDASSEAREDRALVGGGGWVEGKGSNGSSSKSGERLGKVGVKR